VKISEHSEKEQVLHGGVIYWLSTGQISVTHIRRQAEKRIGAADSYLVVRLYDGLPAIRIKPAYSRLVVEGSWSLDLE
jgi:hypothetical protein